MQYSLAGLNQLDKLAARKQLIDTETVRELFALNEQRLGRLARKPEFPERRREGRVWVMDPAELAEYLRLQNRLAAGLSISAAAHRARHVVATVRTMIERGRFPKPFGELNGKPRFDPAEVDAWLQAQRHGKELPRRAAMGSRRGAC